MSIIIKNKKVMQKIVHNNYNILKVYRGDDLVWPEVVYNPEGSYVIPTNATTIYIGFSDNKHPDIERFIYYLNNTLGWGDPQVFASHTTHSGATYNNITYRFTVSALKHLIGGCLESIYDAFPAVPPFTEHITSYIDLLEMHYLDPSLIEDSYVWKKDYLAGNVTTDFSFNAYLAEDMGAEFIDSDNIRIKVFNPFIELYLNQINEDNFYISFKNIGSKKMSFRYMFEGLGRGDISQLPTNIDTSKCVDMTAMFSYCDDIASIDVSLFNTSNVYSMASMFCYCDNITSLDISHFDMRKVVSTVGMFERCRNLSSIKLNKNTYSLRNMLSMFNQCESLTEIDLSNLDISLLEDMRYMFAHCYNLRKVDLRGWRFNEKMYTTIGYGETRYRNMFLDCSNLREVIMTGCDEQTISRIRTIIPQNCTIII